MNNTMFIELLNAFEAMYQSDQNFWYFSKFISLFVEYRKKTGSFDFNDDTFVQDCLFAHSLSENKHYTSCFKRLYLYLISEHREYFQKVDALLVNFNNAVRYIADGYVYCRRNLLEPVPNSDKWLVSENNKIYKIDNTRIKDNFYRQIVKKYYWEQRTPKLETLAGRMGYIVEFLNEIQSPETNELYVTGSDIYTFKQKIQSEKKSSSAFVTMSSVKDFLKYVEAQNLLNTNVDIFPLMMMHNVNSEPNKDYYSTEETELLIKAMAAEYQTEEGVISDMHQLFTIFALFILNSPLRAETLCNLKVSQLHESTKGSWYFLAETKIAKSEKIEVTRELKMLFDEILRLTEPFRNDNHEISDYLFIYMRPRGSRPERIKRTHVSIWIKKIAVKNNLPDYGVSGLRNRFNNKITEIIINKDVSNKDVMIAGVSKHSLKVHFSNYYSSDLTRLFSEMYNVEIAETDLKGLISKENVSVSKKNTVMGGRGICTCATCEDKTLLDCLMCKHFVATPANIPYFLMEIEKLDNQLKMTYLEEEREFLNAKKSLNLAYLIRLEALTSPTDK